jgi:hypothetical protein
MGRDAVRHWSSSEQSVWFVCGEGFGRCRFPCAEVVGDDEVQAASGAYVLGAAPYEAGREYSVDAEAVGEPAVEAGGELLVWGEGLRVCSDVYGGCLADEGS